MLSLGLDSLVFLDDNPVERGLVRKLLPLVAVPELPEEPAYYARTLAAAGYFEAVTFATEDLKRAGFYQDNAKRAKPAEAGWRRGGLRTRSRKRLTSHICAAWTRLPTSCAHLTIPQSRTSAASIRYEISRTSSLISWSAISVRLKNGWSGWKKI